MFLFIEFFSWIIIIIIIIFFFFPVCVFIRVVKLRVFNPRGSLKDRVAVKIIEEVN